MIVKLLDEVFDTRNTFEIYYILHLVRAERYEVDIDRAGPKFQEWNNLQDEFVQELIKILVNRRRRKQLGRAHQYTVIVCGGVCQPNVSNDKITVSLTESCKYLSMPLRIYVEDSISDREFFLAFLPRADRELFLKFEERGWITFFNGGGLTNLQKRVELVRDRNSKLFSSKLVCFFDSDSLESGQPSKASKKLAKTCRRANLKSVMLQRRFIESYIPVNVLGAWIENIQKKEQRRMRRKVLNVYRKLEDSQRHYFNLKEGLAEDRDSAHQLWQRTSEQEYQDLKPGFGRKVSLAFQLHTDEELQKEFQTERNHDDQLWQLVKLVMSRV